MDINQIPEHLKKYVVDQNYSRYTPEDQAVWRYTMRQLKNYLSESAHDCYVDGLLKTGISVEEIPKISEMNEKLNEFGWGAIPVSGFIPPAAFMEFQSLGFLPIASDMRTISHTMYTPAPDIIHEAAGHAPILVDPKFANYLKAYGNVAKFAIISHEDLDLYSAIRELSDIKENPNSSEEDIENAEQNLKVAIKSMSFISEAALLGRMNWWTAEYGLIGEIDNPKIYGAGLLSSVGESSECLSNRVKKIQFDLSCIDFSYDITEPQPQLFVAPDFETLTNVLNELSYKMSFKKGGLFGLDRAKEAKTVCTTQLDSKIQISGILSNYLTKDKNPIYLQFQGPSQLSVNFSQLEGHGKDYHSQGYSTPIGPIKKYGKCISKLSDDEISDLSLSEGNSVTLDYASGVIVSGRLVQKVFHKGELILLSFEDCTVSYNDQTMFQPDWGTFDLAVGTSVPSVFGGPADRVSYGPVDDFEAKRVPPKVYSREQEQEFGFYVKIRSLRNSELNTMEKQAQLLNLVKEYLENYSSKWLIGIELIELGYQYRLDEVVKNLRKHLLNLIPSSGFADCIEAGLSLSKLKI